MTEYKKGEKNTIEIMEKTIMKMPYECARDISVEACKAIGVIYSKKAINKHRKKLVDSGKLVLKRKIHTKTKAERKYIAEKRKIITENYEKSREWLGDEIKKRTGKPISKYTIRNIKYELRKDGLIPKPSKERMIYPEYSDDYVVTVEDLAKAIQANVGKTYPLEENDAEKMAEHVLGFFGFDDCIIDNILGAKDRNVFYMLEESGLLATERDETLIKKGKYWRIYYWKLNKEKIYKLTKNKPEVKDEVEAEASVYDEIPEKVWERCSASNEEPDSSEAASA